CQDRVIWGMNQVEAAIRVHQAEQLDDGGVALKDLVVSYMRLDLVHAQAREAARLAQIARPQRSVDLVEVFLAYEIRLQKVLNLPVSAKHMTFPNLEEVTQDDLDSAQRAVHAAMQDTERVAAYLQASAPWQRQLRRAAVETWSWDELIPVALPADVLLEELRCPITHEGVKDLEQPLVWRLNNACVVYEAAELLKHWVEHGDEPTTRQRMSLETLQRPLISPEGPPAKKCRTA
ncbi:MAG: hypothetical protein EOO40_04715, partial [Deltaproteobacteria bacterium]